MKSASPKAKKSTRNAVAILDRRMGKGRKMGRLVEDARANAELAQLIYAARNKAGFTREKLAKLVGTTQSVVARMEDATYGGHSLSMLNRIAAALEHRVEIRFVAARGSETRKP